MKDREDEKEKYYKVNRLFLFTYFLGLILVQIPGIYYVLVAITKVNIIPIFVIIVFIATLWPIIWNFILRRIFKAIYKEVYEE